MCLTHRLLPRAACTHLHGTSAGRSQVEPRHVAAGVAGDAAPCLRPAAGGGGLGPSAAGAAGGAGGAGQRGIPVGPQVTSSQQDGRCSNGGRAAGLEARAAANGCARVPPLFPPPPAAQRWAAGAGAGALSAQFNARGGECAAASDRSESSRLGSFGCSCSAYPLLQAAVPWLPRSGAPPERTAQEPCGNAPLRRGGALWERLVPRLQDLPCRGLPQGETTGTGEAVEGPVC